jgi:hypothetical protein
MRSAHSAPYRKNTPKRAQNDLDTIAVVCGEAVGLLRSVARAIVKSMSAHHDVARRRAGRAHACMDSAEVVFPATRFSAWYIVAIEALPSIDVTCAKSKQLALVDDMFLTGTVALCASCCDPDRNNRILAAGRATYVRIPADTPVIDIGGATRLPGMIELYAHLEWRPTDGLESVSSDIEPCTLPEFNPILESDLPDLLV